MRLGILPAVGSGLGSMAKTGQLERLYVHLGRYAEAFSVTYFTGLPYADEVQHWRQFSQQTGSTLWPVPGGLRAAFLWPLRDRVARKMRLFRAMSLLGAIPALAAKWRWGIPFVVSHGADYEAIARIHGRSVMHLRKWRWLQRLVFRSASVVLVSREDLAIRLGRKYPKARIVFHPNWIDGKRFSPAESPVRSRRVLYVGRLVEEKNLLRLARAVNGLWGGRLRCVGEGPLQWALGGAHPASYRADCPGPRDWAELPEEYRAVACFVLPSLTEGHPKALLEAMACGLPCAVSDRVGVIRHEETGLVFKAEDEEDMRVQIARLLDDHALAAMLGAAARKDVEQYDINVLMPVEIRILQEMAR